MNFSLPFYDVPDLNSWFSKHLYKTDSLASLPETLDKFNVTCKKIGLLKNTTDLITNLKAFKSVGVKEVTLNLEANISFTEMLAQMQELKASASQYGIKKVNFAPTYTVLYTHYKDIDNNCDGVGLQAEAYQETDKLYSNTQYLVSKLKKPVRVQVSIHPPHYEDLSAVKCIDNINVLKPLKTDIGIFYNPSIPEAVERLKTVLDYFGR